ncbi:hypothetical protein [Paenibacillus radicis (ex Xue et al. 2023)]|uniref:BIG2 domain-containing protein n=1 Tax=Paenibacillus radicis (ex Xue et al. 2023) TaxID=2972489 RepID=A0ABT1Y9J0_9BACL|nr:hypothetical protein [Paenibacillus radicis (ex Xue et al. 2023)]MCR8629854.1 hypothetical protein [Paenibacillus radicis (ex Xue et al. 2023)]
MERKLSLKRMLITGVTGLAIIASIGLQETVANASTPAPVVAAGPVQFLYTYANVGVPIRLPYSPGYEYAKDGNSTGQWNWNSSGFVTATTAGIATFYVYSDSTRSTVLYIVTVNAS